jgi:hypothetical protein
MSKEVITPGAQMCTGGIKISGKDLSAPNITSYGCPFCHQTLTKGINRDFKVTNEDPIICIDCAREVLGTMTLLEGGFW